MQNQPEGGGGGALKAEGETEKQWQTERERISITTGVTVHEQLRNLNNHEEKNPERTN